MASISIFLRSGSGSRCLPSGRNWRSKGSRSVSSSPNCSGPAKGRRRAGSRSISSLNSHWWEANGVVRRKRRCDIVSRQAVLWCNQLALGSNLLQSKGSSAGQPHPLFWLQNPETVCRARDVEWYTLNDPRRGVWQWKSE